MNRYEKRRNYETRVCLQDLKHYTSLRTKLMYYTSCRQKATWNGLRDKLSPITNNQELSSMTLLSKPTRVTHTELAS